MTGGNHLIFLLPLSRGLPSTYVRAKCLEDFEPKNWKFSFIDIALEYKQPPTFIKRIWAYCKKIKSIRSSKNSSLLIIKPKSPLEVLLLKFFLGMHVFVDINDPIHLNEHLGKYSRLRAYLIMKFSSGIIFESEEYHDFWMRSFKHKSTVIEDTPQSNKIHDNFENRIKRVVWFGSANTSPPLISYVESLKCFDKWGYKIVMMGCDEHTRKVLENFGLKICHIDSYDRQLLINTVANSEISFVPMPNEDSYKLRGNLKAKLSMACGALTIASDVSMHRRLIIDKLDGILFSSNEEMGEIMKDICARKIDPKKIANNGNIKISKNFTQEKHANSIVDFISSYH
jgi:hypothetical protein